MILITGASGVLGVALVKALSGSQEEIIGLRSADGDLRDPGVAAAIFDRYRPSTVFHAAARVHGIMGNHAFPADMFYDNAQINMNVIEAARRVGCRKFVAVSTVAAYPSGLALPISESSIWDGPPHHSERFYAHAKRAMLAHLESCNIQYGMGFAYAILTNLYGPEDRFDTEYGHVIPSLVAKFHAAVQNGSPINVWGTGVAKRDFLYADDAAEALLAIAKTETGAFNIATGHTVPVRRVVEILMELSGVTNVSWDATKPDGQLDRSYDVSKLAKLGFRPKNSLESGLAETYKWYSERYPDVRR